MSSDIQKKIISSVLMLALTLAVALYVERQKTGAIGGGGGYPTLTEVKLTAADGFDGDNFGRVVDGSVSFAIVGAENNDDYGNNSGSAYIFQKSGSSWINETKLLPGDGGEATDQFGCGVSVDGSYAAVGSRMASGTTVANAGAVYIYYHNGVSWSQQAKITAQNSGGNDEGMFDYFGNYASVSISGDYVLIGAPADDDNGSSSGSAYIYKRSGTAWNWVAKLTASDGVAGDEFGYGVSLDGNYAVVSSIFKNSNQGAVYVYYKDEGGVDNWGQQAILTASDGAPDDWFSGNSRVSISGDYVIVGAPWNDHVGLNSGAAYVFHRTGGSTWVQEDKFVGSDTTFGHYFGTSVSIYGNYAVVGTPYIGSGGGMYTFERSGTDWIELRKLLPSDGASGDSFASSNSIFTDYILVGAMGDDDKGANSGSAYVYTNWGCTDASGNFPDANFRTCLSNAFGTPGKVCGEDLASLTSLTCSSAGVSSITGANYLTALTGLDLNGNNISDLSPISGLTALTSLNVADNNISSLNPLSGLTNLTSLSLNGNNISDISRLSTLTNLTYLHLGKNYILSNISTVSLLTNLTNLLLGSNNITDISAVSGLTGLTELRLNDNSITYISALAGLINLATLELQNNNIDDLSKIGSDNPQLADFASFNRINITNNPLTDIEDVQEVNLLEANGARVTHDIQICGDSSVDGAEQCDDGNIISGDGCSSTCAIEIACDGQVKIEASDGDVNDEFGSFVSIHGDYAVVTAPGDEINTGAAYVYKRNENTWSEIKKITGSDITIGDSFGNSAFIYDDFIIVGAQNKDESTTDEGVAYIFQKDRGGVDNWGQVAKLTANDPESSALFGHTVVINGNFAFISAQLKDDLPTTDLGKVYIFEYSGGSWNTTPVATILGENGDDRFGNSIAVDGNFAVIGTNLYDNMGTKDWGKIYIYQYSGGSWNTTPIATFIGENGKDNFGAAVAIKGSYIISSAPYYDDGGNADAGKAYIYKYDGANWNEVATFVGEGLSHAFSYPPHIDGSYATMGAPGYDSNAKGAVYLYKNEGGVWNKISTLTGSDSVANDQLGYSAGISGNYILAGARRHNSLKGAIYMFRMCPATGGAGAQTAVPACTPMPIRLDIKEATVGQLAGKPTITLRWREAGLEEISAEEKIEVLFGYLAAVPAPTLGDHSIKLKNIFVRHIYNKLPSALKQEFNSKLGESGENGVCNNTLADKMFSVIKTMKTDSAISSLIAEFVDNLLSLESKLAETGEAVTTPFTDYYDERFGGGGSGGTLKVIRKIFRGGAYITDKTIEINPSTKIWVDTDVPASDVQKNYKYQLVTQSCNQKKYGNEAEVVIDPTVPAGTSVDVTLDFKLVIKDAYNSLLLQRFRELFTEDEVQIPVYQRSCETLETSLFTNINSDFALEYIITCFGEDDETLIGEIIAKKELIVPPLIIILKGLDGELTKENIENYVRSKIAEMKEQINSKLSTKTTITRDLLSVGGFVNETNIDNLSETDEEMMKRIGEQFFAGASHAADFIIEKYDAENNLLGTYRMHTDIFGRARVNVGEFIAGKDYELKIKLANEKFVLPKYAKLQINNAAISDGNYKANINLRCDRQFRYGDFNQDEEINLWDINAWGKLLRGEYENGNGYELWQLWEFANLDGLKGIDLLDVLTLQENWGGFKEVNAEESEMEIRHYLECFCIHSGQPPQLDILVKTADWMTWADTGCPRQ